MELKRKIAGLFKSSRDYEREYKKDFDQGGTQNVWQRLAELSPFKDEKKRGKQNSIEAKLLNSAINLAPRKDGSAKDRYIALYNKYRNLAEASDSYIEAKNNQRWARWRRTNGKKRLGYAEFLKYRVRDIYFTESRNMTVGTTDAIELLKFFKEELEKLKNGEAASVPPYEMSRMLSSIADTVDSAVREWVGHDTGKQTKIGYRWTPWSRKNKMGKFFRWYHKFRQEANNLAIGLPSAKQIEDVINCIDEGIGFVTYVTNSG